MIDLHATFEKYTDEFLQFDRVESTITKRPDLHAFLLLDRLMPGSSDMIEASEHDEFYLSIDCEKLAESITEEQVCELHRCGVRYNSGFDSLCMFA